MKKFICACIVLFSPFVALADETISYTGANNNVSAIGSTAGNVEQNAVKFVPSADTTITNPSVCVWKNGGPTDNLVFAIQGDSGGYPNGTDIGTPLSILGSTLATSCATAVAMGNITATLTSGTTYWLVMRRSGSLDATNRYTLGIDYPGDLGLIGQFTRYVSGAWSYPTDNSTVALVMFGSLLLTQGGGGSPPATGLCSLLGSDAQGTIVCNDRMLNIFLAYLMFVITTTSVALLVRKFIV